MAFLSKQIYLPVIVIVLLILLNLNLSFAQSSGSCASEVHEDHGPSHAHRHCHHEIGHHRHDDHQQQHDREMVWMKKLPEELAEEENLKLLGFGSDHHDHEHQDYSDLGLTVTGFGLWIHAIGCSLLVSLASFICLIILPLVLRQGKPSKAIVDSLAVFGRSTTTGAGEDKPNVDAANGSTFSVKSTVEKEPVQSPSTLMFGYLNLFSDGVHNFTDGMALRSAFLLYGSVGGWSRTLFLLAHELPQAIGDFGILVRSGFSVSTALFFNFLSALVALVGTALGFTAGGFIYIAVAGVLAEMNNGSSALKSTAIWITSLILGMFVAHLPFVYPLLNEIAFVTVLYPC